MGPRRDRVPGGSEPAPQGPVSALYTEGQHVGALSVGGDVVWFGAWLHGAGTGQGQRRGGGQRAAGRVKGGDRFRSAVEAEAWKGAKESETQGRAPDFQPEGGGGGGQAAAGGESTAQHLKRLKATIWGTMGWGLEPLHPMVPQLPNAISEETRPPGGW